jgi:hypothetical protein
MLNQSKNCAENWKNANYIIHFLCYHWLFLTMEWAGQDSKIQKTSLKINQKILTFFLLH